MKIEKQVVTNTGATTETEVYKMTWTIGEVISETFVQGQISLEQGFLNGEISSLTLPPVVESIDPVVLSPTSAIIGGNVLSSGGLEITDRGVYWGTEMNPELTGSQVQLGTGLGLFTFLLENLLPSATYYFIAYAANDNGTSFGEVLSFCTQLEPTVITHDAVDISASSAVIGGEVLCDGGDPVIERGIYWGDQPDPAFTGVPISIGQGIGAFTHTLTALVQGETYYTQAYAINDIGTAYGEIINFTTLNLPEVVTTDAVEIMDISAVVGGVVMNDGGADVTGRGIYWGTDADPVNTGALLPMGAGVGVFTSTLTGLIPANTYYYRSYAENLIGIAWGEVKSFTTLALPVVATAEAMDITDNSALVGGEVLDNGRAVIMERGIRWGTDVDPLNNGALLSMGSGVGVFASTLSGLTSATKFYYIAYAENTIGTAWGEVKSFTTLALPQVATANAIEITDVSALVGGEVLDDGGAEVTGRGLYWGLNSNPANNGTLLPMGSGVGVFTTTLTGLASATTHYYVSYAENSVGIAWGEVKNFTTLALPQVATANAIEITDVSAVVGGEVLDDGGAEVTIRGIHWGTDADPVNYGTLLSIGSGIGVFASTLTELEPGTVYHVVAFATSSIGTAYGQLVMFETTAASGLPDNLPITDITIDNGSEVCLAANNTITVAGNNSTVQVLPGGKLNLVAGNSIIMLDGFSVLANGNFRAWIDTTGEFCDMERSLLASDDQPVADEIQIPGNLNDEVFFKVYPNPTQGAVTVEIAGADHQTSVVEVYNMTGEMLIRIEESGSPRFGLELGNYPRGIYIIRVLSNDRFGVQRIIMQ